MIELGSGNILECQAEALVNPVNCVGVMGRGLALQFRHSFPANFKAYEAACRRGALAPGRLFVFATGQVTLPRFIINFPTKRHWRDRSRLEDIEAGLVSLVEVIRDRNIRSIAIPPLGCGLGGLDWNDVRPRIAQALAPLTEVHVRVFEPDGTPVPDRLPRRCEVPVMTPGCAAMVGNSHEVPTQAESPTPALTPGEKKPGARLAASRGRQGMGASGLFGQLSAANRTGQEAC